MKIFQGHYYSFKLTPLRIRGEIMTRLTSVFHASGCHELEAHAKAEDMGIEANIGKLDSGIGHME